MIFLFLNFTFKYPFFSHCNIILEFYEYFLTIQVLKDFISNIKFEIFMFFHTTVCLVHRCFFDLQDLSLCYLLCLWGGVALLPTSPFTLGIRLALVSAPLKKQSWFHPWYWHSSFSIALSYMAQRLKILIARPSFRWSTLSRWAFMHTTGTNLRKVFQQRINLFISTHLTLPIIFP